MNQIKQYIPRRVCSVGKFNDKENTVAFATVFLYVIFKMKGVCMR